MKNGISIAQQRLMARFRRGDARFNPRTLNWKMADGEIVPVRAMRALRDKKLVIYADGVDRYPERSRAAARLSAAGRKLLPQIPAFCRNCGCTDLRACDGGCFWIKPDLCSSCEGL